MPHSQMHPVASSLSHDSRSLADRSPFGAVVEGTQVDFAIDALPGASAIALVVERRRLEGNQDVLEYEHGVRVPMREAVGNDGSMRWIASHCFAAIGVYGYYFEAEIDGRNYVYQNNLDVVAWTTEAGSNGLGLVGERPDSPQAIRRYRLTVHRSDYTVPEWAADAIYYYIFPERFRNGNPAIDPRPAVDRYRELPIELHDNWMDKPYRPGSGDGSDALYNNDFFGGDIAGIIDKLDYIAELGANALYITPLFTASSNHKYDTADYRNIDPHFGGNDDFVRLTREAARRGIRVIADASLNHTGRDSIYFDRYARYEGMGAFDGGQIRADSPYADWYRFDTSHADPERQCAGWINVLDLPELNKSSPSFREFAFGADDSVMKLWLDRGAAGWRMDVAPWVPDDFWREWRAAIKQHRPDALTIAETWFDASKFFLGDTFDSTMNYIFRNAVLDYANGGNARVAHQNIEYIREVYPPQAFHALMNLLSSHDVARSLHVFGYEDDEDPPEQIARAKQRLRLAVFFQMIFPGAPAIYYGDEVGVTGGEDPYNRACYPWADRGGRPDLELLADYKRLIAMRKNHPVLRRGSLSAPLHLDEHLIVLARRDGESWAIAATNNASSPLTVNVRLPEELAAREFVDALSGETAHSDAGSICLTVPPCFGLVLISA